MVCFLSGLKYATFLDLKGNTKMNLQIPFEQLGHYKSIALNTDDTFYQLTVCNSKQTRNRIIQF